MKKRANRTTINEAQAMKFAGAVREVRRTKEQSLNAWKKSKGTCCS